jgi:hypothetical protein
MSIRRSAGWPGNGIGRERYDYERDDDESRILAELAGYRAVLDDMVQQFDTVLPHRIVPYG